MTCSAQDPFKVTSPTFTLKHCKVYLSTEDNQEQITPSSLLKSSLPFPQDEIECCQVQQQQQNHLYTQAKK